MVFSFVHLVLNHSSAYTVFCLHSCFSKVSKNRVSRGPSTYFVAENLLAYSSCLRISFLTKRELNITVNLKKKKAGEKCHRYHASSLSFFRDSYFSSIYICITQTLLWKKCFCKRFLDSTQNHEWMPKSNIGLSFRTRVEIRIRTTNCGWNQDDLTAS